MNIQQPPDGRNPSNTLSCSHCHTQMPPQAVFCSSCGRRVEKKKEAQEQEDATVRHTTPLRVLLPSLPLEAWQHIFATEASSSLSEVLTTQLPGGRNPSNTLSCSHCHTQMPPQAVFCSSCGRRVEKKKNEERETRLENRAHEAQEQEDATVRLSTLSPARLPHLPVTPMPKQHIPETEASSPLSERLTPLSIPVPDIDTKKPGRVLVSQHMKQRIARPLSAVSHTLQRKVAANPGWLWPAIIILSALAAGLVDFVFTDIAILPALVFWFLAVCPGMMLVRFLRLKEPVVEWTLALALSFAIDATVAIIQLYAGRWSPAGTLSILIAFSLVGAMVQLAMMLFADRIKVHPLIKL